MEEIVRTAQAFIVSARFMLFSNVMAASENKFLRKYSSNINSNILIKITMVSVQVPGKMRRLSMVYDENVGSAFVNVR